jgi:hypothetical protein
LVSNVDSVEETVVAADVSVSRIENVKLGTGVDVDSADTVVASATFCNSDRNDSTLNVLPFLSELESALGVRVLPVFFAAWRHKAKGPAARGHGGVRAGLRACMAAHTVPQASAVVGSTAAVAMGRAHLPMAGRSSGAASGAAAGRAAPRAGRRGVGMRCSCPSAVR